jgi:type IV pilus assembly protein PilY1
MKKTIAVGLLLLMGLLNASHVFAQVLTPAIPPNIVTSTPRPMIMLNMSKDHQLFYRAYDEFSDLTGDGIPETTYAHSFDYYGYFDSYKCYDYSGTSNRFEPTSINTDKYCSGNWSGNFLNWATMTRMDIVRKVLYGGRRSTDQDNTSPNTGLTVLERANLPTDAHSFAKYYKGSDLARLTPFSDQLAPSSLISNNGANSSRRLNQFNAGNNKLHSNGSGTPPAAAIASSCQSKVDAFYPDITEPVSGLTVPDPNKPTDYHCVTHTVNFTSTFTINVGDQVRAVNTGDTSQYMQGVAIEVNTASGWFTMVVSSAGFVSPSATNIKNWLIYDLTQTSATICNTTLGNNVGNIANIASDAAANGDSHTNTNPPIMRVARGDYQLWNANERWQCYWSGEKGASNGNNVTTTGLGAGSSNPSKTAQGVVIAGNGPDFVVRVRACNPSLLGKENCKQYNEGNFKPIGLLHEYGEDNLAEFGLFTGSFAKNISGGVLRSNVDSFRNEVNYLTNGTFTSAKNIVYTLDRLRIYGYRYSDGTYIGDANCTYQLTGLNDNKCTSWGNPMGTMFVESLRYLGGLSPSSTYDYTQSGSKDEVMGLPKPAWVDPFTRGVAVDKTFGQGQCRAVNAIHFNASVTSYDNSARSQWDPFSTLPGAPQLATYVNIIGDDQSIRGNKWFIGNNGTTNDRTCTGKTIGDLSAVSGLCPDAPGYFGSYALAGAAYWARTHAVRTPTNVQLAANPDAFKVKSFSVALAPGKPRIEVPNPDGSGKKIIIQPTYQLDKGGTFGAGTLVDFRVVGVPTATSGKFLIVWEDSEQGGDYDTDVSGILRYEVIGTKLYVYTSVFYAASANGQGFGYTISGSTKDGPHFHSGAYSYTFNDPTNLVVTKTDGTALPANTVNASGGCDTCVPSDPETRAEYSFGAASASQLEDPLWYAAKWGGFSKNEDVRDPAVTPKIYFEKPTSDKANWDIKKLDGTSGPDGLPDNYFLAIRPSELEKALRSAFSAIVSASNTAPAVASAQIQAGSLKYLASFDGDDGHGELLTFIVKSDGAFDIRTKTDGTLDRTYYHWAAHTKLTATAANARQIITNSGNSTGLAFNWASMSNAMKTTALGGTDATAQARLNWLRGDRSNESPDGLRFRKRNANSIMGPVVSSNPTVTSPPNADFFGSAFPGYGTFVSTYKSRKSVVWVGAGDGMLHGFNASTDAGVGGTPIMSYVSQLVHSRLPEWVQPATEKVQSFVDGTPYSADVLIGSTITDGTKPAYDATAPTPLAWKTYLFASLGRGGKGMFALDITNPDNLTETNAASVFKWQFSEADDASGDLGYNLSQIGNPSRISEQASPVTKMNNGKFAVLMPNGINSTNGSAALYILFVNGPNSGTWSPSTNYVKLVADTGPANGLAQATWVDTNNDGVADYIYAGDLKGNIWKFDVSSDNQANWKVAYANTDGSNKRPLFIAKSTDGTTRLPITTAIEYRFHPLGGLVVNFGTGKSVIDNDFPDTSGRVHTIYGIWDNPSFSSAAVLADPLLLDDATTGLPRTRAQLVSRTLTRVTLDNTDPTDGIVGDGYISGSAIDWTNNKGWYISLPDTSEMVVSNPVITQGLLSVVSIAPAATSADICFKGPVAYVTFVDPISGMLNKEVFGSITIGGVTYMVASVKITDQRVTFARDATKTSCASGELNCTRIIGETTDRTASSSNTSARIYWREIPSFKTR